MLKSNNRGLLGLLKKDISTIKDPKPEEKNHWSRAEVKQIKANFIDNCGYWRGESRNNALNKETFGNVEVKTGPIPIIFKKDWYTLIPANRNRFVR